MGIRASIIEKKASFVEGNYFAIEVTDTKLPAPFELKIPSYQYPKDDKDPDDVDTSDFSRDCLQRIVDLINRPETNPFGQERYQTGRVNLC